MESEHPLFLMESDPLFSNIFKFNITWAVALTAAVAVFIPAYRASKIVPWAPCATNESCDDNLQAIVRLCDSFSCTAFAGAFSIIPSLDEILKRMGDNNAGRQRFFAGFRMSGDFQAADKQQKRSNRPGTNWRVNFTSCTNFLNSPKKGNTNQLMESNLQRMKKRLKNLTMIMVVR